MFDVRLLCVYTGVDDINLTLKSHQQRQQVGRTIGRRSTVSEVAHAGERRRCQWAAPPL
jgi:hypothetical protein